MMAPEDRINISLDTLRTEIRLANAELELSLRKYITEEMEKKAPLASVHRLQTEFDLLKAEAVLRNGPIIRTLEHYQARQEKFSQGEFTPAQENSLQNMIHENMEEAAKGIWSQREKRLALGGFLVSIIALAATITTSISYFLH